MPYSRRVIGVFVLLAVILGILLYAIPLAARTFIPSVRQAHELSACDDATTTELRVQCVMGVIQKELQIGGVNAGVETFAAAYRRYENFADSGCHTWAHRVGDFTYYELYWGNQNLDDLNFPQETTACGYGFFHGFLEHDIQDHPTAEYITKTCDYLTNRLGDRMRDIELICYHAGGHGLMVAHSMNVPQKSRGDVMAYVGKPAEQCAALPKANATDIEQCYEGIFNILVNFMTDETYGFSYDKKRPFAICSRVPAAVEKACIYEMAQKIDSASDYDVLKMIDLVSVIKDTDNRFLAFEVGMGGFIQQSISAEGYKPAYAQCERIVDGPYYESCVRSIVWALFEHGDPQREYLKPLQFCADPSIEVHGKTTFCYERVADSLPRFYEPSKIASICAEFPVAYRSACEARLPATR